MSDLTEDAGMTAFEGGKKLYFFKNFENLADAPQNKLLKTLEEPFENVHFILLSFHNTPSLRSVQKVYRLHPYLPTE